MNFFKSVFQDEADPPRPESGSPNAPTNESPDPEPSTGDSGGDGWNFGGLIKTLTSKSESIIETYRRDLEEFGTGLRKEIEVAQGSLGTVGHVIDEFGNTVVKGTAQIISQGKDAILAVDLDSDSDNNNNNSSSSNSNRKSFDSVRYSRFDAQVRAIQGDVSTYTEEPEDLDEFNEWKLGFSLEGKSEEMEGFFRENDAMESAYKKVVPNSVDHESFWFRYYYKVYRLKKAEDVRARLVSGIAGEDEDLSWDVEDDDDDDDDDNADDENRGEAKPVIVNTQQVGDGSDDVGTKRLNVEEEGKIVEERDNLLQRDEIGNKMDSQVEKSESVDEKGVGSSRETREEERVDEASKLRVDDGVSSKNDSMAEADEKVVKEREGSDEKSGGKSNESSGAENQHAGNEEEEEDLGWDEIEDLSSFDEKKATESGSGTSKVDLRKRLSAAEEEEDLSWDIEDDDEPAKA